MLNLNTFNLFLFLFALWIMFMIGASHLSWLYVFFGIIASAFVSIASSRLRLIEQKSELLYLSFGFYRYFFDLFFSNFFNSIRLVIDIALTNKELHPIVYRVPVEEEFSFNHGLLVAGLNMTSGLLCLGVRDEEILVHAIDEKHFQRFDFDKTKKILSEVNDDNLV
jgi:multisubunit Na+/H+ antiporter MnhE subunit